MFLIIINLYLNDDNVLDYSKVCCMYLCGDKNKPILDSVSSYFYGKSNVILYKYLVREY